MRPEPNHKNNFEPVSNINNQSVTITVYVENHLFAGYDGCITVVRFQFIRIIPQYLRSFFVPAQQGLFGLMILHKVLS